MSFQDVAATAIGRTLAEWSYLPEGVFDRELCQSLCAKIIDAHEAGLAEKDAQIAQLESEVVRLRSIKSNMSDVIDDFRHRLAEKNIELEKLKRVAK